MYFDGGGGHVCDGILGYFCITGTLAMHENNP